MTGPGYVKPKERPKVIIPQLTEKERHSRATRAFSSAIDAVVKQHFSKAPPKNEINEINSMIQKWLRERNEGKREDFVINDVLDEYSKNNPDTLTAKYYEKSAHDSSWLFVPGSSRCKFMRAKLQASIKDSLNTAAKEHFINVVMTLSDPNIREYPLDMSNLANAMPVETKELSTQLSEQLQGKKSKNKLPLTITYNEQEAEMVLASTLPPPVKEMGF